MKLPVGVLSELEDIRERVRRNLPRHRRPEAFHEEKSEITARLTEVINALRTGKPVRPGISVRSATDL